VNPGEYDAMARAETRHWWYRALHELLVRILSRRDLAPGPRPRVLDAGCGTGGVLRVLREHLAPSYLGGFDLSADALRLASAAVPTADVYRSDLCDPELHVGALDLVVSLDALYIPGFERAGAGLGRIVARLRAGGVFVLHVPAYDWLYSEHDVALHTSERYTRPRVRRLLARLGLEPVLLTYRLCPFLPLVVATRLPRLVRRRRFDPSARSELHRLPSPAVNASLLAVARAENALVARGVRLPFGSSVLAAARKPPA
jgi:SAM-dependent methyltransferase